MEPLTQANALADISAVELALVLGIVGIGAVGGVAGFLWTRWMNRQEQRVDIVEQKLWAIHERVSTKDDLRQALDHIDARLDRLETRIDAGGTARAAE